MYLVCIWYVFGMYLVCIWYVFGMYLEKYCSYNISMNSKKPNPFNPNSVVNHNLFAGRSKQVTDILNKLTLIKEGNASNFFIVGERGIGKTALSKLIKWIAKENNPSLFNLNLLTAYYSVQKGQSSVDVLEASLNELSDSIPKDSMEDIKNHIGNLLQNGKFSIGAFGLSVDIEGGNKEQRKVINARDQLVAIITNVIKAVRESEDSKDGILIVIDELDNTEDIKNMAQLLRGISTTLAMKDLGYISFIVIGYENTEYLFFEGDESSRRTFDSIYLESMPDNEAIEILSKGFNLVEQKYNEDSLNLNIKKAAGYPHIIQKIGYKLYEDKIDDTEIGEEDWVKAIIGTSIELRSKEFSNLYNFQKKKKDHNDLLLDALAQNGTSISRKELGKKLSDKNLSRTIENAKNRGSIRYESDGEIIISSQLLRFAIIFHNISIKKTTT
jgi:Cdc6-like AAA superfamily ATPase